jgi:translation elongation factor EF-Ts
VKKLKKEVESTKLDIKKAQKASEIGDVDEAVNFLKKFSK